MNEDVLRPDPPPVPADPPVPDAGEERWEVAELIAKIDPTVAPKLLAMHPVAGWCWCCHVTAPCSIRSLAEAAHDAGRRRGRPRPARTAFR